MAGTSMPQRLTRTVTPFRLKLTAIAFLAVSGWGGFAYLSWSEAWAEHELQRHLDELMSEQADAVSFASDHPVALERITARGMVLPTILSVHSDNEVD